LYCFWAFRFCVRLVCIRLPWLLRGFSSVCCVCRSGFSFSSGSGCALSSDGTLPLCASVLFHSALVPCRLLSGRYPLPSSVRQRRPSRLRSSASCPRVCCSATSPPGGLRGVRFLSVFSSLCSLCSSFLSLFLPSLLSSPVIRAKIWGDTEGGINTL